MNTHSRFSRIGRHACWAAGFLSLLLAATPAHSQFTDINSLQNTVGNRIEAATILGGDFGMTGASYNRGSGGNLSLSKFGGWGDIGDPQPLGTLPIAWQPQLQGEMGYLVATKNYSAADNVTYYGTPYNLKGAFTRFHDFSIQFGGGPRLWFNDNFSIAPTIMGMYGYTDNTFDQNANTTLTPSVISAARKAGLIDYDVDTWTIRPAADFQFVYTWRRTIFTLNSDPVYFHTESFNASNPNVNVNGDSETWMNKLDVDVPLGKDLWGHELRTGGYFSRTEFYGNIQDGLGLSHLYEVHGRVVLDYLNQLWKVQWIGLGVSYLWGNNGFSGYSYGLDVAFRF
ncbi:MAG: hypothetical protein ACLQAH_04770 [Limisphaerales bacterium]